MEEDPERSGRRFDPRFASPFSRRLASEFADVRLSLGSHLVLHSLAIGAAVGVVACAFYGALRLAEAWIVAGLIGYESLHPAGEVTLGTGRGVHRFSPLLLVLVPAIGGLAAGLLAAKAAPEIAGGGGDAYVEAFHRRGGVIRKRVAWLKMAATIFTLGSGGSAGREGPTMQVGAAIAALLGRRFDLGAKEQRLLLVAGTAAGLAAMFGTPLGAALLATEVLYRDDFESDALVPAILASVVAYSIFSMVFPSSGHLFAHAVAYPFVPRHLLAFGCLAIVIALGGRLFEATLHLARQSFARIATPWLRPAIGGLALGIVATIWLTWVAPFLGLGGVDVGILGGGSGAAQAAIVPNAWIPAGWGGVAFFAGFAVLKMLTTSLTLGSGGSAGDFGPSLAIGGMLGGAFGRAMQIGFDPSIDPGAFALVGMGAFYGGLANVPISALVIVCELAGNYDLLVPLMLCNVLSFVLLRRTNLYRGQPTSRFESPTHVDARA